MDYIKRIALVALDLALQKCKNSSYASVLLHEEDDNLVLDDVICCDDVEECVQKSFNDLAPLVYSEEALKVKVKERARLIHDKFARNKYYAEFFDEDYVDVFIDVEAGKKKSQNITLMQQRKR